MLKYANIFYFSIGLCYTYMYVYMYELYIFACASCIAIEHLYSAP